MYESFFHFKQRPFAAAPRIDRYFPGTVIESARLSLARSIDRAEGTSLLVGPAGTGKTLVCHLLAEQFRGRFAVAMLSNGHLDSRRELLQAILFELGLPYRRLEEGELRLSLIDYIAHEETAREGLLLLVDEAHTLPAKLLEEVRLIANVVRQGQPRVRLVLAGNPSLEESLADPQLETLSQRVATRCYLDGFDYGQTQQYIVAQVSVAGGDAHKVFTADALEAVYQATGGIPRLINQVCDHALILAFAGGRQQINAAGIEEAWSDLQQLPTPRGELTPFENLRQATESLIEFGHLDDATPSPVMQDSPLEEQFFAPAGEVGPAAEATLLIHQIDDHLSELARDFTVAVSSDLDKASTSFGTDPFGEPFDHEEVLLDRYSSLEPASLSDHRYVESDEGRALAALLTSFVEATPSELALPAASRTLDTALLMVSSGAGNVCFQSTTIDAAEPSRHGDLSSIGVADEEVRDEESEADWSDSPAVPLVRSIAPTNYYDDDLMIVEDDPRADIRVHAAPNARQVRRQEFRQLFSSLRRG